MDRGTSPHAGVAGTRTRSAPATPDALAAVLDATTAALVECDPAGTIVVAEGALLSTLTLNPRCLLGRRAADVPCPLVGWGLRAALAGETVGVCGQPHEDVFVEVHAQPLPGGGARAVLWDVSDKVQLQREGSARADTSRSVMRTLPVGVVVRDSAGRLLDANPRALQIFGLTDVDELAGFPGLDPNGPALRRDGSEIPSGERPAAITLRTGRPAHDVTMAVRRPNGSLVWLLVSSQPMRDPHGAITGVVTSFLDITDRIELEEALREREKLSTALIDELGATNEELREALSAKDELLATTSHELRTPLSAMIGYAGLVRKHGNRLPAERRDEYLDLVLSQGRRLDSLVDDLLTFSRLRAGALPIRRERMELNPLLYRLAAVMPQVDLRIDAADALALEADPLRIEQIVINLVENAVRYGAQPIELRAVDLPDAIELSVRDHGPGVPAAFVPRLFESFTQASTGTTRTSMGSGLGLAIVRGLAEAHGGEVRYEAASGGGARFVVRLPKLQRATPAGTNAAAS